MKSVSLLLLAGIVFAHTVPSRGTAGPVLTLTTSQSEDLLRVALRSTLTISVNLSDLNSEDRLDSLAAAVEFDSSLLGGAMLSPGEIIPDPLDDPLDFQSLSEPGLVEAAFTTLGVDPAHQIKANGIFYTFTVEALRPGSGSLSLHFVDGTLFNDADPTSPISLNVSSGSSIAYTVVPEPESIVLIALASLLMAVGPVRAGRAKLGLHTAQQRRPNRRCPRATASHP